ncbi:hypothetical protein Dda_2294 [Drechslerella dactyloides]|uniref:Uncharacterized protein n=1 Tax=Drechslerella dactyloides TaxID=74499 RepID=A0AAD6NM64_DREDA|nr:hypothetical protein Dda_2294 [Drechslerella dactyloides]
MYASSLISILSLALATVAIPVPGGPDPNGPIPTIGFKGAAWANVTLCTYAMSITPPSAWDAFLEEDGSHISFWSGTIVQYNTYDGWAGTIYGGGLTGDNEATWGTPDMTSCAKVNGFDYCFTGSFLATPIYPDPKLAIWGPNTKNAHVQLPTSEPNQINSAGSNLCLTHWPKSAVQAVTSPNFIPYSTVTFCEVDDAGELPEPCIYGAATWSYYDLPYTL